MSDLIEGLVENTFLIIILDQDRRVQTIPVDNVRPPQLKPLPDTPTRPKSDLTDY